MQASGGSVFPEILRSSISIQSYERRPATARTRIWETLETHLDLPECAFADASTAFGRMEKAAWKQDSSPKAMRVGISPAVLSPRTPKTYKEYRKHSPWYPLDRKKVPF
eukprot:ANDGO_03388.mRNA.1 hypothetical protein